VDPSLCPPVSDITYHEDRNGEYTLSLQSYDDPPLESKFAQLDYFDFQLNNVRSFYFNLNYILI
jgi:hypothetical protein